MADSSGKGPSAWIALILAPLVVTVTGGLVVEWVKPKENKTDPVITAPTGTAPTDKPISPATAPGGSPTAARTPAEAFAGKWYSKTDRKALEVMPGGRALLTNAQGVEKVIGYSITDETITVTESPASWGEVVSMTESELVLNWHDKPVFGTETTATQRYGRESNQWRFAMAQVVFLGLYVATVVAFVVAMVVKKVPVIQGLVTIGLISAVVGCLGNRLGI